MPNYNTISTQDFANVTDVTNFRGIKDLLEMKFKNSTKALDTFYSFSDYLLTFDDFVHSLKYDDLGNLTTNWILFYVGDGTLEPKFKDFFIKPFVRAYQDFAESVGIDVRNWAQQIDQESFTQFVYENPFNAFVRLFNIRVDVYDNPNIKFNDVLGGNSTFKETKNREKRIVVNAKIDSPVSQYIDIYQLKALVNMLNYPTRINFFNPELSRIYGYSSSIIKNYSIRQDRQYNNIKNISFTMIDPQ